MLDLTIYPEVFETTEMFETADLYCGIVGDNSPVVISCGVYAKFECPKNL